MKAIWKGKAIAESDETVVVEGNHYFPKESLTSEYFKRSDSNTICPWKGKASYFNIEIEGEINKDAAWYYPEPSKAAEKIKDHVAFWKGVEVVE